MAEILKAEGVGKVFPGGLVALDGFDLDVDAGDFVALVGPSGCGKTTFLRMAAGFEFPTGGQLLFRGQRIAGPDPRRAVLFQDIRLFPWLTVRQNVAFGAAVGGRTDAGGRGRVGEVMARFGLDRFGDRHPHEISLGTQQKIGLARVLLNDPEVILCDEPFSSIDVRARAALQVELLSHWQRTRNTVVFVTHNVREAVYLARRVVAVTARPGRVKRIVEVDLPEARWEPHVITGPRFAELAEHVADALKDEIRRSQAEERSALPG